MTKPQRQFLYVVRADGTLSREQVVRAAGCGRCERPRVDKQVAKPDKAPATIPVRRSGRDSAGSKYRPGPVWRETEERDRWTIINRVRVVDERELRLEDLGEELSLEEDSVVDGACAAEECLLLALVQLSAHWGGLGGMAIASRSFCAAWNLGGPIVRDVRLISAQSLRLGRAICPQHELTDDQVYMQFLEELDEGEEGEEEPPTDDEVDDEA